MNKKSVGISRELRLKTLKPVLEGKSLKEISEELNINIPTLKYRLTQLYKYYNVSNRYTLMAQYIKFPSELYKHNKNFTINRVNGIKEKPKTLLQMWRETR